MFESLKEKIEEKLLEDLEEKEAVYSRKRLSRSIDLLQKGYEAMLEKEVLLLSNVKSEVFAEKLFELFLSAEVDAQSFSDLMEELQASLSFDDSALLRALELVRLEMENKNYNYALALISFLKLLFPSISQLQSLEGICNYNLASFEEAVFSFDLAVHLDSKSYEDYFFLAESLLCLDRKEEARELMENLEKTLRKEGTELSQEFLKQAEEFIKKNL